MGPNDPKTRYNSCCTKTIRRHVSCAWYDWFSTRQIENAYVDWNILAFLQKSNLRAGNRHITLHIKWALADTGINADNRYNAVIIMFVSYISEISLKLVSFSQLEHITVLHPHGQVITSRSSIVPTHRRPVTYTWWPLSFGTLRGMKSTSWKAIGNYILWY